MESRDRSVWELLMKLFSSYFTIIFLKVSTVSYHCIPQIMPTDITLTKWSSVFCHMEGNSKCDSSNFSLYTFMPCLCSPIFLIYSPWEISLYFSDTGAMILPLWNSSEIIPINLSSAVLWHCAYFNFYLSPSPPSLLL